MRFFNTAGPVNCEKHYCLPLLERFDLGKMMTLIDQEKYFILHSPRQTGKTSCLLALMEYLNRSGKYRALYVNVEAAQSARENIATGIRAILSEIASRASTWLGDDYLEVNWLRVFEKNGENNALNVILTLWAKENSLPIVLLIDEIDSLIGDTLISVLRQLRSGYDKRPGLFPQSIILCGVRDIRDYRIHSAQDKAIITGGSAFNIKAESLKLEDFTRQDVEILYGQHTEETGQRFEPQAIEKVWILTEGQPWLVNAMGYEVCFKMKEGKDRNRIIGWQMIDAAKENIIERREIHIDQLVDKLQEERVQRVIEPILAGLAEPEQIPTDDLYYVGDLGLIKIDGHVRIANPIYREVIPRELVFSTQVTITEETAWYVDQDGRLDLKKLLTSFQKFFREHSEHWVERFQYREAGPQLLLQAFLQRIVNTGGRVEREYGLGRMRTDLLVIWPYKDSIQQAVMELKILHKSLNQTISEGLEQTASYMDRTDAEEGCLVIFDRDSNKSWDEKIFYREETFEGKKIGVWGM